MKRLMAFLFKNSILLIVLAVVLYFCLRVPGFLSITTLKNILMNSIAISIIALGLTFVLSVNKWDVSIGSTASLSAMTTCYLIQVSGGSTFLGLVGGLAVALLCGFLNGLLVAKLHFEDIVATIATQSLFFGLAFLYAGGYEIYKNMRPSFRFIFNGNLGVVPFVLVLTVVIYTIADIFFRKKKIGRWLYSTGNNPRAALFSAVPVERVIMIAYLLSGLFAGFAGILGASEHGRAWILLGQGYLLTGYCVVFLGISIFEKPTPFGTLLSAFFISTIRTGFVMENVIYYLSDIVIGLLLLGAVVVSNEKKIVHQNYKVGEL